MGVLISSARCTTSSASAAGPRRRGRRRHRRGDDRLSCIVHRGGGGGGGMRAALPKRADGRAPRRARAPGRRDAASRSSPGEIVVDAALAAASRTELPRDRGVPGALRHPAGRQRHAPPRDQPGGGARGDGRGGRRRRRVRRSPPSSDRRATSSPASSRASPVPEDEVRQPAHPRARGGRAPAHPRRPGDPRPVRAAPDRRGVQGLAAARGVRIPPSTTSAAAIGRRIELACLADPIELRPCHNDLLNANFIDDGARIRIVDWEYAGWATRTSTSATSASTTS